MSNASTLPTTTALERTPPFSHYYWTTSATLLNFIALFLFYLGVNLIRYFIVVLREFGRRVVTKKSLALYGLCFFSVLMAFGRNIANQIVAFIGWKSNVLCEFTVKTSYIFYSLSLTGIFIFLWLQQNIFYSNSLLMNIIHPCLVVISWLSLLFILCSAVFLTVYFVIEDFTGWQFAATPLGCEEVSGNSDDTILIVLVAFTIFTQLFLLSLFLYPLLASKIKPYRLAKKRISMINLSSVPESNRDYSMTTGSATIAHNYDKSEEFSQQKLKEEQAEKVLNFIQKTCLLAMLTVFTDVFVTSTQFLLSNGPELVFLTFFDINLLTNIMCLLFTFNDWRHILLPFCCMYVILLSTVCFCMHLLPPGSRDSIP